MSQEIDIEKELAELLSESLSAPFLFIGSGFSRRYLDLPDWKGLLSHFSTSMPFDSYLGTADNDFPKAALALAQDFSKEWWSLNKDRTDIYQSANWAPAVETPLKYEISQYLGQVDIKSKKHNNDELKELLNENVVIDGIITTNWDKLLENLFPKLKVYIGQSDLFFKHPQSIGEIFKIHGCISKFPSLILSKNDYENFNKKMLILLQNYYQFF
ncbi:SIR2 family protein [Acinetobacter baumannii]